MKNKIKVFLSVKGMTQKELAEKTGMSEVGVSNAINGSATRTTIERVAKVLGVEAEELIDEEKHYAKYSAEKTPLKLGEIEIPCYVLENGQRVFSGRGIQRAIGFNSKSGQWMKTFCNTEGLSAYLRAGDNSISASFAAPIRFERSDAGGSQSTTYGYDATLLVDICSAIIDANRAGDFNDAVMVGRADIIIRAVAKTGIIALVDEATGYDKEKERAKDELQKFLNTFLREEAAKWVKTFPDSFFEDIYKMRGWTWTGASARPGVVGKYISDLVYERMAPIKDELEKRNPKNENGNRAHRHHQFLDENIAKPKLMEHIASLHTLAIVCDYDWYRFEQAVQKAFPRKNEQLLLGFDD